MTIKIKRGGATSKIWTGEGWDTAISSCHEYDQGYKAVIIKGNIKGQNGGTTNLQIEIFPEDYPDLIKALYRVDKQAFFNAMQPIFLKRW